MITLFFSRIFSVTNRNAARTTVDVFPRYSANFALPHASGDCKLNNAGNGYFSFGKILKVTNQTVQLFLRWTAVPFIGASD